jgi:hypothetical protein
MQLAIALRRLLPLTADAPSGSRDTRARDRETELLRALPPEGHAELFELREAWVARLRASHDIRDRGVRAAERRAAHEQLEREKRELFRRYGL